MLVAATFEEVLYRAYLWGRLTQLTRTSDLSIVISSVLFALAHGYDPATTLSVFTFGLVLGFVFAKSRSLLRVTLAHWGYNVVEFLPSLSTG
jgi:membrane protease YdiL (CAAX protease family)